MYLVETLVIKKIWYFFSFDPTSHDDSTPSFLSTHHFILFFFSLRFVFALLFASNSYISLIYLLFVVNSHIKHSNLNDFRVEVLWELSNNLFYDYYNFISIATLVAALLPDYSSLMLLLMTINQPKGSRVDLCA
jgi:hypothetical protein